VSTNFVIDHLVTTNFVIFVKRNFVKPFRASTVFTNFKHSVLEIRTFFSDSDPKSF